MERYILNLVGLSCDVGGYITEDGWRHLQRPYCFGEGGGGGEEKGSQILCGLLMFSVGVLRIETDIIWSVVNLLFHYSESITN